MLENPETFQTGVTTWFRGPEFAFVLRQGDLATLDRIAATCCDFWNGANSLIIPVRADGRVQPMYRDLLEVHGVETCYVGPSVSPAAQTRIQSELGTNVRHWVPLYDNFDERELHPLLLQPSYQRDARPLDLNVPVFASRRLRRIGLICWGRIHEQAEADYETAFNVIEARGEGAHEALLQGQINGLAPTEQSVRAIEAYGVNPSFARVLAVFDRGSFDELIQFWNLRARVRGLHGRPLLVGVPREALDRPESLSALVSWIEKDPLFDIKPDLGVWTMPEIRDHAATALGALGFVRDDGQRLRRTFVGASPRDRPLSFGFFAPHLGGPFKRGALAHQQITFTRGTSVFRIARPDDFVARSGSEIRVGLEGLPLRFPISERSAAAVTQNAYRSPEGVTIVTDAHAGDGYLRISIPDPWLEVEGWIASEGWTVKPSQAGRYAQALLERLGGLDRLDVLADAVALSVLSALAPLSRKKLVRRLVDQGQRSSGSALNEQVLAARLAEQALFLELHARSATEIASSSSLKKPQVLSALSRLIDTGFVVRGATSVCPQCGYREVLLLNELDERVACRACGKQFLLPVTEAGERQERAPVYKLDGLMGRAMDQDLLPVLLAVRRLAAVGLSSPVRAIWPGLEFTRDGSTIEVDALLSDGDIVWVCECKSQGAGLPEDQLDELLAFARASGARPAIASLSGAFPVGQARRVEEAGGLVLDNGQLLAHD